MTKTPVLGSPEDTTESKLPEFGGQNKYIKWVDGVPTPASKRTLQVKDIQQVIKAAASLPFGEEDDVLGICPDFYGLSYMEVAAIRLAKRAAMGDKEATSMLLDRTVGRPKQSVESTNLNMTYQEYLESINLASQSDFPLGNQQNNKGVIDAGCE